MAKVIIGAEVKVDGLDKAGQSVGTLKKQIKDATNELHTMAATFGETSTQALEAAKKVALLKDRVQDAAETAALFDPGKKFAVFGNVINTVTGGFSALTGAMGLFGDKSSDVEKVLLKVQSAMLFQQGLSAIADASKDFTRLGAIIKSTTIFQQANNAATAIAVVVQKAFGASVIGTGRAFNILKGAIISTGIGALVVLIGVVIDKLNLFGDSTDDATKSQKQLNEAIAAGREEFDKYIGIIDRQTEVEVKRAKIAGKSDLEITKITSEGIKRRISLLESERNNLEIKGQSITDVNKQITAAKIELENLDLDSQIKAADRERELAKKRNEDASAAAKKRLEDLKKQNEELLQSQVSAQLKSIDSDIEAEQIKFENEQSFAEQQRQALVDNQQKQLETKAKLAELAVLNDPDSIENKIAKINADLELELSALAEGDVQRQILAKQASDAIVQVKKDEAEAKKEIAQKEFDFQMTIAEGIANGLDTLAEIAGKQTAAGKVLAIASTVIKTIQGGIAAFTGMVSSIPGPVGIALGVVAAAGVVASGVKAVKQITAVKVPGASGGGGAPSISLPGAPIKPQAQTTTLDQQSINAVGNASNRAYVLETDVTNNQDRITRLNRAARIN